MLPDFREKVPKGMYILEAMDGVIHFSFIDIQLGKQLYELGQSYIDQKCQFKLEYEEKLLKNKNKWMILFPNTYL